MSRWKQGSREVVAFVTYDNITKQSQMHWVKQQKLTFPTETKPALSMKMLNELRDHQGKLSARA
jgi:hypothetical protein